MQTLGNIILDGSLSLYIWGKNVGTTRAIPKNKQAEYRQFVKDYVCQEKDKTDKRKTLSILNSQKTECELHYNDVTNRRGLTDEERIKECKKRFGNIKNKNISALTTKKEKSSKESDKKKPPPKGNIPIWCSAALAAAEGIGRIISMPFAYALNIKPKDPPSKLPKKPEEVNDDRLMIVGDVHNDPAYMTKLKQRIKNALDDPRNGNEKIIVACENRLYDEEAVETLQFNINGMDRRLKRKHGEGRGIKFFYETLEKHIGAKALNELNTILRCSESDIFTGEIKGEIKKVLSEKTFGSPPKSYARAIMEAYKDIGTIGNYANELDTKELAHHTKAEKEEFYLDLFLIAAFPPFGDCKDILDITNYKRIAEDISLYEDFKDNDRIIFKMIDEKREDFYQSFDKILSGINSIVEAKEVLEKEDFTNMNTILKECFSDVIDIKNMIHMEEKFLPDYYKREKRESAAAEDFNIFLRSIRHKNLSVLRKMLDFFKEYKNKQHIKTKICSYMRSLGMLEEGRALAKEYPNSEIIMFMGQYHSYDLQNDAPHANFNERYKINDNDLVIDDEE